MHSSVCGQCTLGATQGHIATECSPHTLGGIGHSDYRLVMGTLYNRAWFTHTIYKYAISQYHIHMYISCTQDISFVSC